MEGETLLLCTHYRVSLKRSAELIEVNSFFLGHAVDSIEAGLKKTIPYMWGAHTCRGTIQYLFHIR